jgi:hypothetical protein
MGAGTEIADARCPDPVLQSVKEKLVVTDLVNKLDIADGLKELLINKGLTLKLLLNASASDLAKVLGIDEYIAKIVSNAIKKTLNTIAFSADLYSLKK